MATAPILDSTVGDLVIWDNRCTLHRASPFESNDRVREMRSTTIIETQGNLAAG